MDPTNDPNFTPPSLNRNIEPTAPLSEIPSNAPIQPFVLADLGDSVDAPPPHPSLSEAGEDKNKEKGLESRIPRKHTDLSTSSSEEEESHPEKPINKGDRHKLQI
ncbi:hypothetical protein QCA50_017106 [Cerrena zonata]|uniref:Uncharacterized protein n=1 Tax=Cerrena zonata TaxID=2478898 RepID=A0AAW0FFQ7_9APHY